MVEPFVNDRLLDRLRVRAGRRQFILTGGGIEHEFMIDLVHGLKSLDDALKIHAARQKYEVAVFLDDRVKLEFLTPDMSGTFDQVVRGVSCDSRAGDRQVRTFTPRARRGGGDASGSEAPSENRERATAAYKNPCHRHLPWCRQASPYNQE